MREYKKNQSVRQRYFQLFSTRENLTYHISWAKSRGDEWRNMADQLIEVDAQIDDLEHENQHLLRKSI